MAVQQPTTQRYAGPIAAVLAALAVLGALWHAAYHTPQVAAGPTQADADAAAAWRTAQVRVVDGSITVSRYSDAPGFALLDLAVPRDQLYDLPPAKDEIIALHRPGVKVVGPAAATWLHDDDLVFGIQLYGRKRCYPRNVLARHSVINDELAGEPILLYFDPPSGAAMAFIRPAGAAGAHEFAVSGVGYGGMGLLYDWQTQGLWYPLGRTQLGVAEPISGPLRGRNAALKQMPGEWMTWAAWRKLWPDTTVLSRDTGYAYDYSFDPYTRVQGPDGRPLNYYESDLLLAPERLSDAGAVMPDKTDVLGVRVGNRALAIPVAEAFAAASAGPRTFTRDSSLGQLKLHVDAPAQRVYLTMAGNVTPTQLRIFWYAWRFRCPDTQLWRFQGDTKQENRS